MEDVTTYTAVISAISGGISAVLGAAGGAYQARGRLAVEQEQHLHAQSNDLYARAVARLDAVEKELDDIRAKAHDCELSRVALDHQLKSLQEHVVKLEENVRATDRIVRVHVDTSMTITYISEGVYAVFGWKPASLLGKPLNTLLPADAHEHHTAAFTRAVASNGERPANTAVHGTAVRADGTRFRVFVMIDRLPGGAGYVGTIARTDA